MAPSSGQDHGLILNTILIFVQEIKFLLKNSIIAVLKYNLKISLLENTVFMSWTLFWVGLFVRSVWWRSPHDDLLSSVPVEMGFVLLTFLSKWRWKEQKEKSHPHGLSEYYRALQQAKLRSRLSCLKNRAEENNWKIKNLWWKVHASLSRCEIVQDRWRMKCGTISQGYEKWFLIWAS